MRQRKSGQLAFVSSQLGFLAAPLATDYDSAKVAIRLYAEGLRVLLWKVSYHRRQIISLVN